jgi:type I restriction enzyme, R subunit
MDKRGLSERDICTKFISPALRLAGWDEMLQIREEVGFTKGRIIVRGKLVTRGQAKRADYILYYKPNIPLALIEAKDNAHSVGHGMQQALDYANTLVFHDRTGASTPREQSRTRYLPVAGRFVGALSRLEGPRRSGRARGELQDYYGDGGDKAPRYCQVNAVNAAIEAIAKGRNRVLLVMATGTGKTYTAFQVIWRLWKAGRAKRVLYLADRNVLIDCATGWRRASPPPTTPVAACSKPCSPRPSRRPRNVSWRRRNNVPA